MANYTPVRISGPETYRLADMHGVLQDLEWLINLCGRILRYRARGPRPDSTEMEALEGAALIRYGRCFKGGARTAFILDAQWIVKLPQELQDAHRDFLALRDKHVAHSVNDWELNIPVANLRQDEKTGESEVSSVSVQSRRIIGLTPDSIDQLKRLAESLVVLIQAESKAEAARVLAIAKQIPIAELEARLTDPAIRTGVRQLDSPRGR
jgi:hypothetical protein